MEGEEVYLGGFYSPLQLGIGRFSVGAGVYATSRRLFVLGHGKATFPSSLNKIVAGSDKGDFIPTGVSRDQNEAIIQALTSNRLFEISKDQVSRLEFKKPPGAFRTGWLKIAAPAGQIAEIKIAKNKEFEWTVRILQSFKPEAVTMTDD